MRSLIKNGELGKIRIVKGSYLQILGLEEEETGGNKQAEWRRDQEGVVLLAL